MEIKKMKLTELKPATYNPRKDLQPGDPEYEMIKKSILDNGLVQPIIWNKKTGNICAGHQRYKIIKQLGYEETEVVVIDVDETKEKSMNIMLNKAVGDWDDERLALILQEAKKNDWLDKTGFEEDDITALLESLQEDTIKDGLTDPDDVPEAKETKIKIGDIFKLGKNRLMCGDATDKRQVEALMGGGCADMVFTDPPYGVDLNSKNMMLKGIGRGKDWGDLKNDVVLEDLQEMLVPAFENMKNNTTDSASWYIWHGGLGYDIFKQALMPLDFLIHRIIIWNKSRLVLGRGDFHWKHEHCIYGWIKGNRPKFYGGHNKTTVWDVNYGKGEYTIGREHPTQKPVELCEKALFCNSKKGHSVLDLFGGSGTTLIACEQTDRICYMMELDPVYVEVIKSRWERFTGNKAEQL